MIKLEILPKFNLDGLLNASRITHVEYLRIQHNSLVFTGTCPDFGDGVIHGEIYYIIDGSRWYYLMGDASKVIKVSPGREFNVTQWEADFIKIYTSLEFKSFERTLRLLQL